MAAQENSNCSSWDDCTDRSVKNVSRSSFWSWSHPADWFRSSGGSFDQGILVKRGSLWTHFCFLGFSFSATYSSLHWSYSHGCQSGRLAVKRRSVNRRSGGLGYREGSLAGSSEARSFDCLGRKPCSRAWERISFHLLGFCNVLINLEGFLAWGLSTLAILHVLSPTMGWFNNRTPFGSLFLWVLTKVFVQVTCLAPCL